MKIRALLIILFSLYIINQALSHNLTSGLVSCLEYDEIYGTVIDDNNGKTFGTIYESEMNQGSIVNLEALTRFDEINGYAEVSYDSESNTANNSILLNTTTETVDISAVGETSLIFYSNTIPVTSTDVSVYWPTDFPSDNYFLYIRAWTEESINGEIVQIQNGIYDFNKTTSGFTLKVRNPYGYLSYFAVDTTISQESTETFEENKLHVFQTSHGLSVGDWIRNNGTSYVKSQANVSVNAEVLGVVDSIIDDDNFIFQFGGIFTKGTWTVGTSYFLSPDISGDAVSLPEYTAGEVQLFLGTGVPNGLLIEIDVGTEIAIVTKVDSLMAGDLITTTNNGVGDVTVNVDLSLLSADETATLTDSIPWIDSTNGQKKMPLSTLKALVETMKWDGDSSGLNAATGRTSLGANTVGSNIFTSTNPSAITFLRVNADNTVDFLSSSNFRTAIGLDSTESYLLLSGGTLTGALLQEVESGTKTANFVHDASAGNIGAYRVNLSSTTLSINNLSDGNQGTVFLNFVTTTPTTLTVNTYSDNGSTGLTEIVIGSTPTLTVNKTTTVTYTCVNDGTNTYVYLVYGQQQ